MADKNPFLQFGDTRRMAEINGRKIILSAEDRLDLDETGPLEGSESEWYVYAEQLDCPERFHIKNGLFAVHGFVGKELYLSADGDSGKAGVEYPGKTDIPQLEGGAGGRLALYLEQWEDNQKIRLTANGGEGGSGQNASIAAPDSEGQDGGNGGNGGTIWFWYQHKYFELINQLGEIYQLKDDREQDRRIRDIIMQYSARPELSEYLKRMEKKEEFTARDLIGLSQFLSLLGENWRQHLSCEAKGGFGGIGGAGSVLGKSGKGGREQKPYIQCIPPSSRISFLQGQELLYAHPDQCEMVLQKAKLSYFALDPAEHPEETGRLSQLLLRLMRRTEPFYHIPPNCPLAQAYQREEGKIGARGSLERLGSVYREASALRWNLHQGLDYMGRKPNYVPLLSYESYKKNFLEMSVHMSAMEKLTSEYVKAARHEADQEECHWNMRAELVSIEKWAEEDLKNLERMLQDIQNSIILQERKADRLKPEVIRLISKYQEAVKKASGFELSKILSSLTLVAFVPKSPIMWGLAGAEILEDASKSLTDDMGYSIRKDYVIHKMEQVSLTLEKLNEGFTSEEDGELHLSDPGGRKLLAVQDEWNSVLEKLSQKLGGQSKELKETSEEFVETVLTRNNYVLEYNQIIGLIRKKHGEKEDARGRMKLLEDQRFKELCMEYPADYGMVEAVYQHARMALLDAYHLAAKSYGFWSLQSGRKLLTEIFGPRGFQGLSQTALESAAVKLLDECQRAAEKSAELLVDSKPVSIPLSESQIDDLQYMGMAAIQITPNFFKQRNMDNPFAGMYDVRVRGVKVFLEGLEFSGKNRHVRVTITQTGEEQCMDHSRIWHGFSHESKATIFEYNSETKEESLSGTFGEMVGNQVGQYALIGPFSMWRLEIQKEANRGMDYSNITGGWLEFQICCRPF